MKENWDTCLASVLKHEGGYVDHPKDPGGATNLGVTIGTLSQWLGRKATKAEVKALTVAAVSPIYKRNYWDKVRGDELPSGLDNATFDFAVNSGPAKSVSVLQSILGVTKDGRMGPETLAAIKQHDVGDLINRFCDARMAFLKRLTTYPTFGRGWSSRVAGVRKASIAMAAAQAAKPIPKPSVPEAAKPQPTAPAKSGNWLAALISFILSLFKRK